MYGAQRIKTGKKLIAFVTPDFQNQPFTSGGIISRRKTPNPNEKEKEELCMKEKEIQSAMDAAKEEPIMLTTTATEMQNNFGKYLNSVIQGQEMIITKNGTPVARIIPQNQAISYLTDSLTGILKEERELYFRRELERMDRESIYEDGALSASARNIKNLMQTQKIPLETAFAWLNIPEAKQRLIKEELKE